MSVPRISKKVQIMLSHDLDQKILFMCLNLSFILSGFYNFNKDMDTSFRWLKLITGQPNAKYKTVRCEP